MAGKIHRYEVAEESPLLPGIGPFPEPDFWSNEVPIMAICEPTLRAGRKRGDWIFHVPKKGEVQNNTQYQVTGILKVSELLNSNQIYKDSRFNEEWTRRFKIDIANSEHVVGDLISNSERSKITARQRVTNHLIGDPEESAWFGRNDCELTKIASQVGINLGSFAGQEVAALTDDEANRLANALKDELTEGSGTPPNAVFEGPKK